MNIQHLFLNFLAGFSIDFQIIFILGIRMSLLFVLLFIRFFAALFVATHGLLLAVDVVFASLLVRLLFVFCIGLV